MNVGDVQAAIAAHNFTITTELELQAALEDLLNEAFPGQVRREVPIVDALGQSLGRIDLVVGRVGIEVKVGGSPGAVARQLLRYQRTVDVDEVLLVTNRMKHCQQAPVGVFTTWIGAL